ncbi:MAG: hypothetical protein ACR2LT_02495 [Pyrinomonadaceae bacterium]
MKRYIFLISLLFLTVSSTLYAQKRRTPIKPAPKKTAAAATAPLTEISAKDFGAVTAALDKEDWTQAAFLSSLALAKLKTENGKKQLAQIRYFYLYALAGKTAQGKMPYSELEKIAGKFIGEEFLMPRRTILADCTGKVNYICAVKDDHQTLRVTATDRAANIHSFEYVKLDEAFDLTEMDGKSAMLGGNLEKIESYANKSNVRILRLFFTKGFVNIAASR